MPKASILDSHGQKALASAFVSESHQRDRNITAASKSPHADDKTSNELSLDELLSKNEDLSDPNIRALLTAMGVHTTADLTLKTLPDLVQVLAKFCNKLSHVAKRLTLYCNEEWVERQ